MQQNQPVKLTSLLLFALLAVSIFLYIIHLDTIPTSVHGDEGETALQALDIIKGKTGIIGVGWFDLPVLSFVPHAITMAIFGDTIVADRLGSVLFGILTLPVFYLLVATLFTRRTALIATLLLGTSHLWLALSRLGITYVQATFFVVSTFYFVAHGLKTGYKRDFILGGILFGLCFYSYYAARIIPLIILPYFFLHAIKYKNSKKIAFQFLILLASAVIIFAPQGKFFLEHPDTFSSRTKTTYVFSSTGREWTNYNKSDPEILIAQTQKTFNIFAGDNSTQYGYKGQLLDHITITFFFLGLFYAFINFRKSHIVLILWLSASLIAQILTTIPTPIFLPRFVVGLPVFFIFVALGFEVLMKLPKSPYAFKISIVTILIALVTSFNLYSYFVRYPQQIVGDLNARAATNMATYLISLPDSYTAIFTTPYPVFSSFGTLRFLSPHKTKIDSGTLEAQLIESQHVLGVQTKSGAQIGDIVYIIYPQYTDKLAQLSATYPNGKFVEFKDIDGRTQFFIYQVKK